MAYATHAELMVRYPALDKWAKDLTEVSSELLYYAEADVDAHLGQYFTTPFSPVYPTIKDLTLDAAYAKALWRFDVDKAEKFQVYVNSRFGAIVDGHAFISTGSGTLDRAAPGMDVWSTTAGYYPVFSMLDAENPYTQVDSSRLDDLERERGRT